MSMIQLEKALLSSRSTSKKYRGQTYYFLYDHHLDPVEFQRRYPGSLPMALSRTHDWQWFINEEGKPNIRPCFEEKTLTTPLFVNPQDVSRGSGPVAEGSLPSDDFRGTYGYLMMVSKETQEKLAMTHRSHVKARIKAQTCTTGVAPCTISAYTYFDVRNTREGNMEKFSDDILRMELTKWLHGITLLRELGVSAEYCKLLRHVIIGGRHPAQPFHLFVEASFDLKPKPSLKRAKQRLRLNQALQKRDTGKKLLQNPYKKHCINKNIMRLKRLSATASRPVPPHRRQPLKATKLSCMQRALSSSSSSSDEYNDIEVPVASELGHNAFNGHERNAGFAETMETLPYGAQGMPHQKQTYYQGMPPPPVPGLNLSIVNNRAEIGHIPPNVRTDTPKTFAKPAMGFDNALGANSVRKPGLHRVTMTPSNTGAPMPTNMAKAIMAKNAAGGKRSGTPGQRVPMPPSNLHNNMPQAVMANNASGSKRKRMHSERVPMSSSDAPVPPNMPQYMPDNMPQAVIMHNGLVANPMVMSGQRMPMVPSLSGGIMYMPQAPMMNNELLANPMGMPGQRRPMVPYNGKTPMHPDMAQPVMSNNGHGAKKAGIPGQRVPMVPSKGGAPKQGTMPKSILKKMNGSSAVGSSVPRSSTVVDRASQNGPPNSYPGTAVNISNKLPHLQPSASETSHNTGPHLDSSDVVTSNRAINEEAALQNHLASRGCEVNNGRSSVKRRATKEAPMAPLGKKFKTNSFRALIPGAAETTSPRAMGKQAPLQYGFAPSPFEGSNGRFPVKRQATDEVSLPRALDKQVKIQHMFAQSQFEGSNDRLPLKRRITDEAQVSPPGKKLKIGSSSRPGPLTPRKEPTGDASIPRIEREGQVTVVTSPVPTPPGSNSKGNVPTYTSPNKIQGRYQSSPSKKSREDPFHPPSASMSHNDNEATVAAPRRKGDASILPPRARKPSRSTSPTRAGTPNKTGSKSPRPTHPQKESKELAPTTPPAKRKVQTKPRKPSQETKRTPAGPGFDITEYLNPGTKLLSSGVEIKSRNVKKVASYAE